MSTEKRTPRQCLHLGPPWHGGERREIPGMPRLHVQSEWVGPRGRQRLCWVVRLRPVRDRIREQLEAWDREQKAKQQGARQ